MKTQLPLWKKVGTEGEGVEWNGGGVPPAVGTRTRILLNGWENCRYGEVVGYFDDHGILFIAVKPDQRPLWHQRAPECGPIDRFVGSELSDKL